MLGAARLLLSKRPAVEFLVSVAYTFELKKIEAIVGRYGKDIPLTLVDKGITSIFEKADLVMATSGTVTLEVAIRGIPEVILYRVSPLSYWFGKMLVKVNYIGLANLIAGREIVPELIQDEANPDRIAHECDSLLKDNERMELMKKEFEAVRNQLGNPGASKRTAEIALRLMRIGKDNPD
jgi:lipid-A-disaccharide synthase